MPLSDLQSLCGVSTIHNSIKHTHASDWPPRASLMASGFPSWLQAERRLEHVFGKHPTAHHSTVEYVDRCLTHTGQLRYRLLRSIFWPGWFLCVAGCDQ